MPLDPKSLLPIAYRGGYPGVLNGFIIGEDGIIEGSQGHKIEDRLALSIEWYGKSWAVTMSSRSVLDKVDLIFVCSPLPSSRTNDDLDRTRFSSIEEACDAINRYREQEIADWREHLTKHPDVAKSLAARAAKLMPRKDQ